MRKACQARLRLFLAYNETATGFFACLCEDGQKERENRNIKENRPESGRSNEVRAMNKKADFVIIGAGPAGMTAALYASRAGLKTVMIDASAPGGKLLKTYLVDNYPGVPEIPGPDLAIQMYQQSVQFGAEFMNGRVKEVTKDRQVILEDGEVIEAKTVLIATGAKERLLNVPGEEEAIGHGESFCAVCDGAFFRNKDVAVIGGGNSALEESQFLTQFVNKVIIIIRRDVFRAETHLQDKVEENPKIEVIRDSIPVEVKMYGGRLSGLVIENVKTKERTELPVQGLFPYIGHIPETEMVADLGITDQSGYIPVDVQMHTSVPGIFAAGDCTSKDLRQIVTAAGDGAIAAQQAFKYIEDFC